MTENRTKLVLDVATDVLSGMVSGPYFSVALVNAMQRSERTTLGSILTSEAWDLADSLVTKYEEMASHDEKI